MNSVAPDDPMTAPEASPSAEPPAGDPSDTGSRRLAAVLARCRAGLEGYGARRAKWWSSRIAVAATAARQARSLGFGRKGAAGDHRHTPRFDA